MSGKTLKEVVQEDGSIVLIEEELVEEENDANNAEIGSNDNTETGSKDNTETGTNNNVQNGTNEAETTDLNKPVPIPLKPDGTIDVDNPRFKCPICNEKIFRSDFLIKHFNMHHSNKIYKCDHCSKQFSIKQLLIRHVKREHKAQYKCKICSKKFRDNASYKLHLEKDCVKCDKCNAVFTNHIKMKEHEEWHAYIDKMVNKKKNTTELSI